MDWFYEAFGSFSEMSVAALIAVVAIIAVGIIGFVVYRKKTKGKQEMTKSIWTTKELTTAALCIGAAFLLSFIKMFSLPTGGSITPASMLPILAFAYIYGTKKGLLVGLCYSLLQFVQEPVFLTPVQFILDYVLAFSLLGLAGLAKKHIAVGIAYGCAARFFFQFLSGVVFWGAYAPEGMPVWLYSLAYSGSIVGIEAIICIVVALVPALNKVIKRAKMQATAQKQSIELLSQSE